MTPVMQLVSALVPVKHLGEGIHRITVQLHPAELGAVQVRVELHGDVLKVHLAGMSEAARDVLRASLPDLHRDLTAQGMTPTSLDVSSELSQQSQQQSGWLSEQLLSRDGDGGARSGSRQSDENSGGTSRSHSTASVPSSSSSPRPRASTTAGNAGIDVRV